jgi:multicomponent Na+:H+ antiporter subunit C
MEAFGLVNYWTAIAVIMIGFYGLMAKKNLFKQALALSLFQTGVLIFYVSQGVYRGDGDTQGLAPVWLTIENGLVKHPGPYNNPLPHVLMLTAIVVSVATLAVAVALIINIKRRYGTVEEDEIIAAEQKDAERGTP